MGRPQSGLPRLRVWASGIAIGPDHTPHGRLRGRFFARWRVVCGGEGVVIFSGSMAVSVEMQHTGDRASQRDVVAVIEHVLADRPGDWRVSIVGSQANDRWEMRIVGPNAFERSYTLEGSAGEHDARVIGGIVSRMLPR
jgi:hypothetical protein